MKAGKKRRRTYHSSVETKLDTKSVHDMPFNKNLMGSVEMKSGENEA